MKKIKIVAIKGNRKIKKFDCVTEETLLSIFVNNKKIVKLLTSPKDLNELIIGHLYSEGIINDILEIKKIKIYRQKLKAYVFLRKSNAAPERCNNSRDVKLSVKNIILLMQKFKDGCLDFKKTGGVHSAALCDRDKILIHKEDLGRHNAIDKVVGEALLKGIDFQDKIMLSSGRLPSEVLSKIIACHIPVVVSVSAPTYQAVAMAHRENITLIGFCRSDRMNIYSGEQRIMI